MTRNLIIIFIISVCLTASIISVYLFSKSSATNDNGNTQMPPLNVVIVHFDEGYASSIKHLLESKGINVEVMPVASLNKSIIEPYDLIIITGSKRILREVDYIREYNKPVLGYGVYGCAYFGKLQLKNGWPYT
jgi:hypothetical protein